MLSTKLIELIKKADPDGTKHVILSDAANNWHAKPLTAYNGRYSTRRNISSLDLPLSASEKRAGHREEDVLKGAGVKPVVIVVADM